MDLFTYLMAKNGNNTSVHGDLFSYLLGKGQSQTQTVSGVTIYIPNAKKLVNFMMTKESTQETTTGKSIFKFANTTRTHNGITGVIDNNVLKVSGTASSNFSILTPPNASINLPAGDYTFAINKVLPVALSLNLNTGAQRIEAGDTSISFTLTETTTTFDLRMPTTSGTTYNFEVGLMIANELNQTYEPYTGGIPSPNPDYPQEVKTVKGYINIYDGEYEIGSYSISTGEKTTGSDIYRNKNFISVKPDTNYTFCINNNLSSYNTRYFFYDENKTYISSSVSKSDFIVPNNCYFVNWHSSALYARNPNGIKKPMIIEGTNLLPYVPYGNNYVTVKVVGKNLFDKNNLENGYYTASGVKTSDTGYNKITTNFIKITSNTIISFSANVKIYSLTIYEFDENKNWIKRTMLTQSDPRTVLTITTNTNTKYVKLSFNYDQATIITQDLINSLELQCEHNNTRTTYEQYQESIITIPLNNNELVGLGNYKDELIVDKSGHVFINKKIGKYIFTGNETFTSGAGRAEGSTRFNMDFNDIYTDTNPQSNIIYILSNYFLGTTWNKMYVSDTTNKNLISNYNNTNSNHRISIRIDSEIASTNQEFQTYLQTQYNNGTPVISYYVKSSSETIDLQTTVDLSLFKGVNNVSNSEDGYMTIEYK